MDNAQLELFPKPLLAYFQQETTGPRKKNSSRSHSAEEFALALSRALVAENITGTTWAIMTALSLHEGKRSIVLLTVDTGMSYHAIRNQALRNLWFEFVFTETLVHLTLSDQGRAKLARVKKRLCIP